MTHTALDPELVGGQPVLRFHVHFDASDSDQPQIFTADELAPLPGATATTRPEA